jgi:hypothetical protein
MNRPATLPGLRRILEAVPCSWGPQSETVRAAKKLAGDRNTNPCLPDLRISVQ